MGYKKAITLLILLSVLVKILFLFISGVYQNPQIFEYEDVADNLLKGRGFYYTNFQTKYYGGVAPGFPILCYLVYKLFGHNRLIIVFIQILTTSLLIVPISLIAHRIFDKKTAVLAGFLTALFPPLIVYSTSKLHSLNIYCLLFALLVWSFLFIKESITTKRAVLVGVLAGFSILFRFTSIVFFVLGLAWFYFASRERAKKKFRAIFVMIIILFLFLLPSIVRSYVIFGKPIFLQTNKGESFWLGNMPGSTGSLFTEGGIPLYEKASAQLPAEFFEMNEIEKGNYLKKITLNYFRDDPAAFIIRIIKKFYYFCYFSPYQGSQYPTLWMKIYKIYYHTILVFAILSVVYNFAVLRKKSWIDAALIGFFIVALACAHSIYYVEARHRWAIECLVLIFTANGFIVFKNYLDKRLNRNIKKLPNI